VAACARSCSDSVSAHAQRKCAARRTAAGDSRGDDAEGVCPHAVGSGALDRGGGMGQGHATRMVPTRLRAHTGRTTPGSRWHTFSHVSSASGAGGVRLRRRAPGTASRLEQRRAIAEQRHSVGGTPRRTAAGVTAQGGRRTRGLPCGVGW
jgi:hypothetical protein